MEDHHPLAADVGEVSDHETAPGLRAQTWCSQRHSLTGHCLVRGADDLACFADGGVADLRILAHERLLGRVESHGGLRMPLDLHDDGPFPVERE